MLNKEKINLFSLMFLDQKLEFNYKKYNWKTEKNYFLIKNYILLFGCSLQIYFTNIISKFIDSNSFIHSLELSVLFLIILSSTFLIFTNDKIQFHYGSNLNILTGIFFFTMYNIKRIFFSDSIYYTLDGMTIFSLSVQYLSWVILIFSVVKANFKIMILLYLICACPWLYTFLVVSKISFMQLFLYHLMPTIFVILNHYQKELKNRQYFYSERLMSNSLKKYFGDTLTEQLISEDGKIKGENQWVTISFIDIASYSSIIEKMSPEVAVEFLNEYFTRMHSIIKKYNGVILNYIGDCVMVVYGAPKKVKNHEILAVQSALDMRFELEELNKKWDNEEFSRFWKNIGIDKINFRIGIHSGNLIIGNIGSEDLLQYSAIGDVVNIASRLEKINKEFNTDIAISEEVFAALTQKYSKNAKLQSEISLKGKTKSTKVYTL